jgi:hypothetical protein
VPAKFCGIKTNKLKNRRSLNIITLQGLLPLMATHYKIRKFRCK